MTAGWGALNHYGGRRSVAKQPGSFTSFRMTAIEHEGEEGSLDFARDDSGVGRRLRTIQGKWRVARGEGEK